MRRRPPDAPGWTVVASGEDGFFMRSEDGLRVQASWGAGWDHVSVSRAARTPTWEEMARVKRLLFEPEECAVQYHPPRSRYKNRHPYCLHMWRPQGAEVPMPPLELV